MMMDETARTALITESKRKLNITWADADTDARLSSIIADAEIILNHKLGAEIEYSAPGVERSLFLNYVMYAWNNCTDEFDQNYLSEIYQIRQKYEVAAHIAEKEAVEDESETTV